MQIRFASFPALAALGVLALSPAWAQNPDGANRLTTPDTVFANHAAQAGIAEVELGQLAKQRTNNPAVQAFAQRMIDDHTRINNELKSLAEKQGMTLPTAMAADDQAAYNRLSNLQGAAFDHAYIPAQISAHKQVIAEFREEAKSGTDPQLKTFASQNLPTLEQHLALAEKTERELKK